MFFNRAKSVESEIDKYLDNIIRAGLLFEEGVNYYLSSKMDRFNECCSEIEKLESASDELRRDIKYTLYKELLIPDARGDVLGLLETLDNVIDTAKKVLMRFSIEKPIVWPELTEDFKELTVISAKSVSDLVSASRAFFRDITSVPDFLVKVHFWEHEADKIEEKIMRKAFDGDFIEKFSYRVHVRYFAERISMLADESEAVAERLEVYTVKRSI